MKQKINIPFLTITLFLTAITILLFNIYSLAHWPVLSNAYTVQLEIESLDIPVEQKEELVSMLQKTIDAGHVILLRASYPITGLLSFISSIAALFLVKGKKRFIPLSFGLISLLIAIIMM